MPRTTSGSSTSSSSRLTLLAAGIVLTGLNLRIAVASVPPIIDELEREFGPRLDVEWVLVAHGQPVLRDGARALAASLARPPWSRSSLY